MVKLIYIAHPIGGDVKANIESVLRICREIHTKRTDIIPFAPYLVALNYLDDTIPEERALGMASNHELFRRKVMDAMWLYGPRISSGMNAEVKLCLQHSIPLACGNPGLEPELDLLVRQYSTSTT